MRRGQKIKLYGYPRTPFSKTQLQNRYGKDAECESNLFGNAAKVR